MRHLATIRIISNIKPIEGKDRIALATVDGWQVIIQKTDYSIGDKCVYCEIDSVLPEKPEFEFLRNKNFTIKTLKMAGVLSQGICFPLSILPKGDYNVGDDVTKILGVTQNEQTMDKDPVKKNRFMRFKWFRKLCKNHKPAKEDFPPFISKTDQERIQNLPQLIQDKDHTWIATEKVDGQSGTFILKRHKSKIPFFKDKLEYFVCSRNKRLIKEDDSTYWTVFKKYKLNKVLLSIIGKHEWVAIQGECIGPKVQGNKYKVDEPDLYVFDIIYDGKKESTLKAKATSEKFGLKFVPIVCDNYKMQDTINDVLEFAHDKSKLANIYREGIVFRRADNSSISFKAVDPLFLLKYDE